MGDCVCVDVGADFGALILIVVAMLTSVPPPSLSVSFMIRKLVQLWDELDKLRDD